jgi:hypothetical protein
MRRDRIQSTRRLRPARRPAGARRVAGAIALAVAVGTGVPAAVATFTNTSVRAKSTFTAAPDWTAPQASSTVVAKATGYLAGSIKQGGLYYVYANVADSGNPASGLSVATTDVSTLTVGAVAIPLVAGSYSVNGVSYTHRSAVLTAIGVLGAGSKSYSISTIDLALNSGTQTGFTSTVDNTAPSASNIQTANGGGGAGHAALGDTITYTFSEQIDPQSVLSGWTGASTNVVVRLIDGGCLLNLLVTLCNDDSFVIYNAANSAQLPFGTVDLNRNDYHGNGIIGTASPALFGASGTPSTMVQSGSAITVTLGTASTGTDTAGGNGTMSWSPSITPYDGAGNVNSAASATESGGGDKDF